MSLFDRIGNGVVDAGNNLSQKAKELSEQNRLNSEITKRENRRKECFAMIGEMYYSALKQGTSPDFSDAVEEIDVLSEECSVLKEELRKIKGASLCPSCNMEVPGGSAFCPNCGTELKRMPVCNRCGAPLDEGAKFCVQCGNRVAE